MSTDRLNFTRRALDALPSPSTGRDVYKDSGGPQSVRELYLHAGTASRTFFFVKKIDGRTVRYRIGEHPAVSIEAARKRARELAAGAASGVDPNVEKRARRQRGMLFGEAVTLYIEDASARAVRPLRASTASNYKRSARLHFASWKNRPARDIGFDDVAGWYRRAAKTSPTSANAALRLGRAVFNHLHETSRRRNAEAFRDNPFAGHVMADERARSACVESADLPAWFEAVETLRSATTRDYLHVLLFTGLRRREAAALRWENVDLRRRTLSIADTKSGEPLVLPLSTYLTELLKRRDNESTSEWVFPSSGRRGYLAEPKNAIRRVADRSGVEASPHALRRTFSNVAMNGARIPEPVRKRLLNHAADRRDVTARHYTTLSLEELRPHMQAVTDALLKAGQREMPVTNVVELRAAS